MGEVETADLIIAFGADPINEAPMLALAMRQAQRTGAEIFVFDPRPISLPFPFHHEPVAPDAINGLLAGLIKNTVRPNAAASLGAAADELLQKVSACDWGAISDYIFYIF